MQTHSVPHETGDNVKATYAFSMRARPTGTTLHRLSASTCHCYPWTPSPVQYGMEML